MSQVQPTLHQAWEVVKLHKLNLIDITMIQIEISLWRRVKRDIGETYWYIASLNKALQNNMYRENVEEIG